VWNLADRRTWDESFKWLWRSLGCMAVEFDPLLRELRRIK
jgi:hypothetical protein